MNYLLQPVEAEPGMAILGGEITHLRARVRELERQLTAERLERSNQRSDAAGRPTINIWLGPDGRPCCEAPSLNGARRKMPELVTPEQADLLREFAAKLREKRNTGIIIKTGAEWNDTARKHGQKLANSAIGHAIRHGDSVVIVHKEYTRAQKAWDSYHHEEGIILAQAEKLRRAKQPVPSSEQIAFWVHDTLRRYGFTPEEIAAAQTSARPKAEAPKKKARRPPKINLLEGL